MKLEQAVAADAAVEVPAADDDAVADAEDYWYYWPRACGDDALSYWYWR